MEYNIRIFKYELVVTTTIRENPFEKGEPMDDDLLALGHLVGALGFNTRWNSRVGQKTGEVTYHFNH